MVRIDNARKALHTPLDKDCAYTVDSCYHSSYALESCHKNCIHESWEKYMIGFCESLVALFLSTNQYISYFMCASAYGHLI
jgi:hypothetical protein